MDREKEQAFIRTVRERKDQLYRVALGYLHSAQDAEDAVSDALEATWISLDRIRSGDALPAYLIRCTINAAKTQLRKRKRTEPLEPYREILETIKHSCAAFRIRRRRNFTDRLVVCDIVFFRFGPDGFTVYSDDIRRLIYLRTQFGDDCSVYGNMAAGNKLFSIPSGSDAAGSKIFLKPH